MMMWFYTYSYLTFEIATILFFSGQLVLVCGMSSTNAFLQFSLNSQYFVCIFFSSKTAIKCILYLNACFNHLWLKFNSIRFNFDFNLIAVRSRWYVENWLKVQVIWYMNLIYDVLTSEIFWFDFSPYIFFAFFCFFLFNFLFQNRFPIKYF